MSESQGGLWPSSPSACRNGSAPRAARRQRRPEPTLQHLMGPAVRSRAWARTASAARCSRAELRDGGSLPAVWRPCANQASAVWTIPGRNRRHRLPAPV
jgi:hypothetical protein